MHKGGIHRKERFGLNSFTFVKISFVRKALKSDLRSWIPCTQLASVFINASHEVKKSLWKRGAFSCTF